MTNTKQGSVRYRRWPFFKQMLAQQVVDMNELQPLIDGLADGSIRTEMDLQKLQLSWYYTPSEIRSILEAETAFPEEKLAVLLTLGSAQSRLSLSGLRWESFHGGWKQSLIAYNPYQKRLQTERLRLKTRSPFIDKILAAQINRTGISRPRVFSLTARSADLERHAREMKAALKAGGSDKAFDWNSARLTAAALMLLEGVELNVVRVALEHPYQLYLLKNGVIKAKDLEEAYGKLSKVLMKAMEGFNRIPF